MEEKGKQKGRYLTSWAVAERLNEIPVRAATPYANELPRMQMSPALGQTARRQQKERTLASSVSFKLMKNWIPPALGTKIPGGGGPYRNLATLPHYQFL